MVWSYTLRELSKRYKDSFFGFFWALLRPLMSLAVYAFVRLFLFHQGQASDDGYLFLFSLFCGILPYQLIREVLGSAATEITGRARAIKLLAFPSEIYSVCSAGSSMLNSLFAWLVCVVAYVAVAHGLHWTVLLLPLALLPLFLLALAGNLLLAAFGVFVGDLKNFVQVSLHLGFFLTPVLYELEFVPERVRWLMWLNPLTTIIESCRGMLLGHEVPWLMLGILTAVSALLSLVALQIFVRLKQRFPDVL
jgi:lipopolysaccharide transport system permease protein